MSTSSISDILGLIGPMNTIAKGILAMIEVQDKQSQTQNESIRDLRIAIEVLKSDGTAYKMLLESILTSHDKRPLQRLCQSFDGIGALRSLDFALVNAKLLLEHNRVGPSDPYLQSYSTWNKSAAKRPPMAELILALRRPNYAADNVTERMVSETTKDIEACRNRCECAFKAVWYIYAMHQQAPHWRSSFYNDYRGEELGYALNNILISFNKTPFSVSAVGPDAIPSDVLMILQRTHKSEEQHKSIMERAGKAWVNERLDRLKNSGRSGKIVSKVQALGQVQSSLFELLWTGVVEQLKKYGSEWTKDSPPLSTGALNPEGAAFQTDLLELEKSLLEAIVRARKQRFAIAFCGMVKAGKSLFLNALIGESILPSGELPATAWPCRLRHVPDQTVPQLEFDDGPFKSGLAALRIAQYGEKLKTYRPPSDNIYDVMFEGEAEEPSYEEVKLKELYAHWVDLHASTKKNLLEFETPSFSLPSKAVGYDNVKKLLSQLNDIVRLCHKFQLGFDMEDVEWPLLTVEFNSLRGHQMDGIYEFIDLPGIGEKFESFDFESMIRLVAKDSNAIVPIVSFKELPRSDWKRLPEIVAHGFGSRTSVVVCTHLDHINLADLDELLMTTSKVFWPRNIAMGTQNIIPCSSLMGLSARALLDLSRDAKPEFTSFWDKQRKKVEYPCAEKILGTGQPEQTYDRMSASMWRTKLENNLEESGLPSAINKLTSEMVDQAKRRAFLSEAIGVCKQLRKMNAAQERKLLETRRSKAEFDAAKKEYDVARAKFLVLIESWSASENLQVKAYEERMKKGILALTKRTETHIKDAIEKTLKSWSLGSIEDDAVDGVIGRGPEPAKAMDKRSVKVLVVKSIAHAEEFLRLSQRELQTSLNREKQDFVTAIRRMAEEARGKRFQELKDEFARLDPLIQAELREEIIEDLNNQSVDVRQVVFNHIKNEARVETRDSNVRLTSPQIKTTKTRHTAATAFRAIEERLAKPLLSQKEEAVKVVDEAEQKALKTIDDLGFMFRAPIRAMATIPFVFGLPVWPWMIYSQSFHLKMNIIESRYRDEIVTPWLRILQEESWKSLYGTIVASSSVAREAALTAIFREDGRYERESAHKSSPAKAGMIHHLVTTQSNLCAAEGALMEIQRLLRDSLNEVQA